MTEITVSHKTEGGGEGRQQADTRMLLLETTDLTFLLSS